ncbi:unnamed protein product, partial [Ectocarpus fasciculatus]
RANELEALFKSSDLAFRKVKKIPNKDFAFVTFDNDEDMQKCVSTLHGVSFRKNKLEVSVRNHVTENTRKRSSDALGTDGEVPAPKRVKEGKDAVSPWWNIPYQEQLQQKQANMKKDCLGKMASEIIKAYKVQSVPKKFQPAWLYEDAMGLRFNDIISSPEVVGYRNKCEFTFGKTVSGSPGVGFRVSSFQDGALVASPEDSPTVPNAMKIVARTLNEFACSSPLSCYDLASHSGVWRTVMLRYSKRTRQLTLMLCVCLPGDRTDGTATDAEKLVHSTFDSEMADSDGQPLVTGLCYQVFNGLSVPASDLPYTNVFGVPALEEYLLGCHFEVSPQAFFQVNTRTAELLFSHAEASSDVVPVTSGRRGDNVCLDVCCGTGTIGICVAAQAADAKTASESAGQLMVLGVDLCAPAIDDAWRNAARNGILPAYFVPARAEALMEGILYKQGWRGCNGSAPSGGSALPLGEQKRLHAELTQLRTIVDGKRLLAIVDPPREGLHTDCLRAIRNCRHIERLIYVSCNPTGSLPNDCTALCSPKSKRLFGSPFRPVSATPVDLFPMTPHCEMVVVFERVAQK